jgi:ketosteroid isomerase-like protein
MKRQLVFIPAMLLLALACTTTASAGGASPKRSLSAITEATRVSADAYFKAYFGKDWKTIERLADEGIRFSDPTAALPFGPSPEKAGNKVLLAAFKKTLTPLDLDFQSLRTVYSGEYAIYEGSLTWTSHFKQRSITATVPLISILRVVDGKIVEHRDYADYQPFIDAERASRPKDSEPNSTGH